MVTLGYEKILKVSEFEQFGLTFWADLSTHVLERKGKEGKISGCAFFIIHTTKLHKNLWEQSFEILIQKLEVHPKPNTRGSNSKFRSHKFLNNLKYIS